MSHGPAPEILAKASKATIVALIVFILAFLYQINRDLVLGVVNFGFDGLANKVQYAPNYTYYDVVRAVDGDTIIIQKDGAEERIRLIGINTPETVDPRKTVECFGNEASTRMKELTKGKIVRLEYDTTQGLRDTYDRTLAYVYLEDGQMLNRKMIAEGYAYEYTYMAPYKYQKEFKELQTLARVSERGLWAPNACSATPK